MTVTEKSSRKRISGSGWTNPLQHDFLLENASYVEVYADDLLLSLGDDYTVEDVLNPAGYEVVINNPDLWDDIEFWTLSVVMPVDQPADISLGGSFGARYEAALDATTRRLQYVYDLTKRSPVVDPTGDPEIVYTFPAPEPGLSLVGRTDRTGFENMDILAAAKALATATLGSVEAALAGFTPPTSMDAAIGGDNVTITTGRPGIGLLDFEVYVNGNRWLDYSVDTAGVITLAGADDQGDGFTTNARVFFRGGIHISSQYAVYAPLIPQQYGIIGFGNDDAAFETWIAEVHRTGKKGLIPRATYTVSAPIEAQITSDIEIEIEAGVVFDKSAATDGDCILRLGAGWAGVERVVDVNGDEVFLNTATQRGELTFVLSAAPANISENDEIAFLNTVDYSDMASANGGRTYYRQGEMARVKQVSTTSVTVCEPMKRGYAVASTLYLYKLTRPKVKLTGGFFRGNPAYEFAPGVLVELAHVEIDGVSGTGALGGVVALRNCSGTVSGVTVFDPETNKTSQNDAKGYGVSCIGCDDLVIRDPNIVVDRHAVTFTGGGTEDYTDPEAEPTFLTIPNYDCCVEGGTLSGGYYGLDAHGHADNCGARGTTIHGGVQMGGRRFFLEDCTVTALAHISGTSRGEAIQAGELIDLNVRLKNVDIYLHDLLTNAPNGLVNIVYDNNSVVEGGDIHWDDVRVHGPASNLIAFNIRLGAGVATDFCIHANVESVNELRAAETEKSPLFDITVDGTATGKWKQGTIRPNNVTLRTFAACENLRILEPSSRASTEEGLELTIRPHAAKQLVTIDGGQILESTKTGCKIAVVDAVDADVAAADTSVTVVINKTTSLRNNQTNQSSTYRNSFRLTGMGTLILNDPIYGDDASSPTQTQGMYINLVGKLLLGPRTRLGSLTDLITNITSYLPGSVFDAGALSTLPAATIVPMGQPAVITDATAPTWGATAAGGGAVMSGVRSNTTNWLIG